MSHGQEIEAHVRRRYEIVGKSVGKGAYGIVYRAIDKKTKATVALKKCFDAFRNATDAQRTYREIQYLKELGGHHDNIIRLTNVMKSDNDRDIYLVFEFMDTDLHLVVRHDLLADIHKKYIIYQLLRALKYLHSAQLVHRDIKPANLLLNSECKVKVCDFGLCRSLLQKNPAQNAVLTDYVATRWYRAPEILLGSLCYTEAVDMWAVGCILGEMLLGKPLFPGTSTLNQLGKLIEVTGVPSKEDIDSINSSFAQTMLENVPRKPQVPLSLKFSWAPPEAIDLMEKCLVFNPTKRITAVEALAHPYCKEFHTDGGKSEPSRKTPIIIDVDDHDKLLAGEYRKKLYDEIEKKKRERRKRKEHRKGSK